MLPVKRQNGHFKLLSQAQNDSIVTVEQLSYLRIWKTTNDMEGQHLPTLSWQCFQNCFTIRESCWCEEISWASSWPSHRRSILAKRRAEPTWIVNCSSWWRTSTTTHQSLVWIGTTNCTSCDLAAATGLCLSRTVLINRIINVSGQTRHHENFSRGREAHGEPDRVDYLPDMSRHRNLARLVHRMQIQVLPGLREYVEGQV